MPTCGTPCDQISTSVPEPSVNTWFWLAPIIARRAGLLPVSTCNRNVAGVRAGRREQLAAEPEELPVSVAAAGGCGTAE